MDTKQAKLDRLRGAMKFEQADRVAIGDFFWTGFRKKCINKWGDDFDPYFHFDLDYVTVDPNMDPKIQDFEILEQTDTDTVLKTGFGATIRRRSDLPMPHFEDFSVKEPEEMADFVLEDPTDQRRFFEGGDNQLSCIGDALVLGGIPSWSDRIDHYCERIPVFGTACDPYEYIWRCIGSVNALEYLALEPEMMRDFIDRIGSWMVKMVEAQIKAGAGRLSGLCIWGDVAYRKSMFFSPKMWREMFKPHVKALIDMAHDHGLLVLYHGCGRVLPILDDYAQMGLDAYNPLEAKAGQDVVQLKDQFHKRMAFCGNLDVRELETNNPDRVKREVLYKLQAARGGGWICQSDHSITSQVDPETYELVCSLIRDFGRQPIDLDNIAREVAVLDKRLGRG